MNSRHLHSIDDLSRAEVEGILAAARRFEGGDGPRSPATPFSVGLLFLSPSLRTRVGFAVAAQRLGGAAVEVRELRGTPEMSATESFADTLRVLSGSVDVTVLRTPFELDSRLIEESIASPYVNAGIGETGEHPTQSLVDLYAIERCRGPHTDLRIGICGDLSTRTARSLIKLLDQMPPRELSLIAPEGRDELTVAIGSKLEERTSKRERADFSGLDVLYMAGLPAGQGERSMDEDVREAFALTKGNLRALPDYSIVLSPMPVVDEISSEARRDPRVRVFEQSDCGIFVRMAVLDALRA